VIFTFCSPTSTDISQVPNVFLRPPNQRKEADAAKQFLTIPEGDHLTLLNIYNSYIHSKHSQFFATIANGEIDKNNKDWAWNNYLSARSLAHAENVRSQILRIMERCDLELTSRSSEEPRFYDNIRKSLVCGFFMQVAHKTGQKNGYNTVKDNQVRFQFLHPVLLHLSRAVCLVASLLWSNH
jgi:pre-mRNA-splicing factor ATP-dependent RNA helicase DHX15/PRP43